MVVTESGSYPGVLVAANDSGKAIVDWAGSQVTHQRVSRISVDADE